MYPNNVVDILLSKVIIGTIGNALTLAVMLRPKYRRLSTSVYLMCLAVVDTLYLYVSRLTIHGWEAITTRNMFVDSQWSCKVLEGLGVHIVLVFRLKRTNMYRQHSGQMGQNIKN